MASANKAMEKALQNKIIEATSIIEQQVDAEIEKLEKLDEDDIEGLRRKRIEDMKKHAQQKQDWLAAGHGEFTEIAEEKDFFDACKRSKNLVCHFYRNGFMRCAIVDKHLSILSSKHLETRFIKINAERAPFLSQRLHVRVLPTLALVREQKTVDYIVGFDDLGNTDDFSTEMLEWRIAQAAIINYDGDLTTPPTTGGSSNKKSINITKGKGKKNIRGGDDSDSDSD